MLCEGSRLLTVKSTGKIIDCIMEEELNSLYALASRLYGDGKISIEDAASISRSTPEALRQQFLTDGTIKRKRTWVLRGAGLIGSNFIHHILDKYPHYEVINYDKLTYAGNLENLRNAERDPRYSFMLGDITDEEKLEEAASLGLDAVINFAAETHVGRSVFFSADEFVRTNVLGTYTILEMVRRHPEIKRFVHVSTDEVYGSVSLEDTHKFVEDSSFMPNVPYAAAKAGGDLLCRSQFKSYQTPVVVTHCSNNYGPYQHPEKFIPNSLFRILRNQPITLHGAGQHVRDWIYVRDHCEALDILLHKGVAGEVYNIGADHELNTAQIANTLLNILGKPETLITHVPDRPGNDLRYSISAEKMKKEFGWQPKYTFEDALVRTVHWYENNIDWVEAIKEKDKDHAKYI